MGQFKIAVIGCGGVSRMHFDGYIAHPDRLHVVAACDIDPERVRAAQQKYEFDQAFTSVDAMIDGADWTVGVVCTPTPVRLEVVKTLAAAGKHVFVEKPLADSYAEAEAMVQVCEQAGVQLAVDQNFRYHFPYEHARTLIADGLIGDVVGMVHQDFTFRQDKGWRTSAKRHVLSVMGVHWFDGFRWILQDVPQSILCTTRSSPAIDCDGETDAYVNLLFEKGAMVSYAQSFSTSMSRAETVVTGETGTLVIRYDGIAHHDPSHRTEPKQTWENPYRGSQKPESAFKCLDDLLVALERRRKPTNSGRDNLRTIAILDGAYCSAEEHRTVLFREGVPV